MKKVLYTLCLDVVIFTFLFSKHQFLVNIAWFATLSGYLLGFLILVALAEESFRKKYIVLYKYKSYRYYQYISDVVYLASFAGLGYFVVAFIIAVFAISRKASIDYLLLKEK